MTARCIFTGTSHFPTLREEGTVYVDKTAFIHRMARTDRAFFLSRPRRFGKSLLVTTMEAYFQGRRDLFEGLAIAALETEWIKYPVLRFDMSGARYIGPANLDIPNPSDGNVDDAIINTPGLLQFANKVCINHGSLFFSALLRISDKSNILESKRLFTLKSNDFQ